VCRLGPGRLLPTAAVCLNCFVCPPTASAHFPASILGLLQHLLAIIDASFANVPGKYFNRAFIQFAHNIFMLDTCLSSPQMLFNLGLEKQRMHEDVNNQTCHLQQMVCG